MSKIFRSASVLVRMTMLLPLLAVAAPAGARGDKPFAGETIRILFVTDPFAFATQKIVNRLQEASGATIQLEVVPYDAVHQKILLNAQQKESAYDAVPV